MKKGNLSGWFLQALITPLGVDKLTACHTLMHTHMHMHSKIFLRETMQHFVYILCCV